MNILAKLWAALNGLTASIHALTETVDTINDGLRQHVGLAQPGLFGPTEPTAPPLEHQASSTNGAAAEPVAAGRRGKRN